MMLQCYIIIVSLVRSAGDWLFAAGRCRPAARGDDWRFGLHQVGGALPRAWQDGGGPRHQEVGQGHCQETKDGDKEMWV